MLSQRHCHAKPWLGAAPSGPQLRPQSPVLGAREGHPPAGSTGPGARRCLESGLSGPQSPVRGEGAPRAGKEAPKSGQIEGTVPTPPTAWRRCPGSLRERKRQRLGAEAFAPLSASCTTLTGLLYLGPSTPQRLPPHMLPAMGKLLWKPTGTMGLGVQAAHLSHRHPLTNTQTQEGLQRSADSGWPTSPKSRTQIQPKNLLPSILSPIHPPFSLNT